MKRKKKDRTMLDKKKKRDNKKDIVIFDMKKTPLDYNVKVVEMYMRMAQANPMLVGVEIGKLYGFITARAKSLEEADVLIDLLDRILNIHTEAGTYNGFKKVIPFKFKTISRKERFDSIQEMKALLKPKKAETPIYTG